MTVGPARGHAAGDVDRRVHRALIAAGAILDFAIGADSGHGFNVHAAGVIAIGAGELGLLPLLIWGPLNPVWRHRQHPQSRRPVPPEDRRVGHQ